MVHKRDYYLPLYAIFKEWATGYNMYSLCMHFEVFSEYYVVSNTWLKYQALKTMQCICYQ